MKDATQIIFKPLITEKAAFNKQFTRYFFKVAKTASKAQIKNAVEKLFNVKVKKVNTVQVKGHPIKRWGKVISSKPNWKKAVITLFPNEKIDLIEGLY